MEDLIKVGEKVVVAEPTLIGSEIPYIPEALIGREGVVVCSTTVLAQRELGVDFDTETIPELNDLAGALPKPTGYFINEKFLRII